MTKELQSLYRLLGETKSDIMEINQKMGKPLDFKSDFQRGYLYGIKVAIVTLENEPKWKGETE